MLISYLTRFYLLKDSKLILSVKMIKTLTYFINLTSNDRKKGKALYHVICVRTFSYTHVIQSFLYTRPISAAWINGFLVADPIRPVESYLKPPIGGRSNR